ncbi:MAG: right-handed parallel beta-helix repeat-containing protein, partial [Planctomycetes bacterium]|nr:right-handed parallel beta-helix repeat-containing protein [Planctomycetota bacterium]
MARKFAAICVVLFVLSGLAAAKTIYVPGDENYIDIQSAINAPSTVDGDEIVVGSLWADPSVPQIYYVDERDIDFKGKAITVRSMYGPAYTIIDCQGTASDHHQGFRFHNGESYDSATETGSVVRGFTIKNGYGYYGGAIECLESSPLIRDCIITQNKAEYFGGGIECYLSSPFIFNCLFYDNEALFGGAIDCEDGSPMIRSCTFDHNSATVDGGGIFLSYDSQPWIYSSIFTYNSNHAIYEYSPTPDSNVELLQGCLFYENSDGDFHDADDTTYTGADDIDAISPVFGLIRDGDPNFVRGPLNDFLEAPLGKFYLSQKDTDHILDSPALNGGMGPGSAFFDTNYTTRTDDGPDEGSTDTGYHYRRSVHELKTFWLTTDVQILNEAEGTLDPYFPSGQEYSEYSSVIFTANLNEDDMVSFWSDRTTYDGPTGPSTSPPQGRIENSVAIIKENLAPGTDNEIRVTVTFDKRPKYQLTVTPTPAEGGTVQVFYPDAPIG